MPLVAVAACCQSVFHCDAYSTDRLAWVLAPALLLFKSCSVWPLAVRTHGHLHSPCQINPSTRWRPNSLSPSSPIPTFSALIVYSPPRAVHAGILRTLMFYPLDFSRTRLTADTTLAGQPRPFHGIASCLRQAWAQEGILSWYKGLGMSLPGVMVYTSISFTAYDSFKVGEDMNVCSLVDRAVGCAPAGQQGHEGPDGRVLRYSLSSGTGWALITGYWMGRASEVGNGVTQLVTCSSSSSYRSTQATTCRASAGMQPLW